MVCTCSQNADRPSVSSSSRLPVDGRGDHEATAIVAVDQPAAGIHLAATSSQRQESCVIEDPSPLKVVAANHDVCEHFLLRRWTSDGDARSLKETPLSPRSKSDKLHHRRCPALGFVEVAERVIEGDADRLLTAPRRRPLGIDG
jgi:hypothetical protein